MIDAEAADRIPEGNYVLAGEVRAPCRQLLGKASNGRSESGFDTVATGSYFALMRAVGIKTLKNKLSEYIRAVAAGETVLVTDRGRVVAELAPPRGEATGPFDSPALRELVRQGVLTLPTSPLRGPPPRKPVMTFEELMEDLARDREDR